MVQKKDPLNASLFFRVKSLIFIMDRACVLTKKQALKHPKKVPQMPQKTHPFAPKQAPVQTLIAGLNTLAAAGNV